MTAKSKESTRIAIGPADEESPADEELAMLAEKYGVSLSWLTRRAIVKFLKMQGRGGSRFPVKLPIQIRGGRL